MAAVRALAGLSALVAVLVLAAMAGAASAQVRDDSWVHVDRMSLSTGVAGDAPPLLAMLATARDGTPQLVLRSFDRASGFQTGTDAVLPDIEQDDFVPADVLVSSVLQPRDERTHTGGINVLGESGDVRLVSVRLGDDGSPVATDDITLTLARFMGDGSVRARRLAEMPNPEDPSRPLLGIGTDDGRILVVRLDTGERTVRVEDVATLQASGRTIDDLEVVPQAGPGGGPRFGFAAVAGGDLLLVDPDADPLVAGLQPDVTDRLVDPRRVKDPRVPPILDIGVERQFADSQPPKTPEGFPFVAADGTASFGSFETKVVDGTSNTLVLKEVHSLSQPVRQVVLGSLATLAADGSGIAYDRRFSPEEGVLRTLWTIAGASAELAPQRPGSRGRGRWITAWIEVESGRAADIDPGTVRLEIGGVHIAPAPSPAPELVLHDRDRNPELQLEFDRRRVLRALAGRSRETPATLSWRFFDGSPGRASAVVPTGGSR